MLVTTTSTLEGREIVDYLGIVSGETIIGANLFKDFLPAYGILLADVPDLMRMCYVRRKRRPCARCPSRQNGWVPMP